MKPVSISGYLRENAEVLKALYENMEVVKQENSPSTLSTVTFSPVRLNAKLPSPEEGRSIFVDLESLALRSQDKVVCRISGNAAFMPLSEPIERDSGKEYRIGDMNELETIGFLKTASHFYHVRILRRYPFFAFIYPFRLIRWYFIPTRSGWGRRAKRNNLLSGYTAWGGIGRDYGGYCG